MEGAGSYYPEPEEDNEDIDKMIGSVKATFEYLGNKTQE